MRPELGCQKVVEQWVEAAAHAGQAQGHWVELTHGQPRGTVGHDVLRHHEVEQEVEVVRGKAEQEEGKAAQHHSQGAPLLSVGVRVQ